MAVRACAGTRAAWPGVATMALAALGMDPLHPWSPWLAALGWCLALALAFRPVRREQPEALSLTPEGWWWQARPEAAAQGPGQVQSVFNARAWVLLRFCRPGHAPRWLWFAAHGQDLAAARLGAALRPRATGLPLA